MFKHTLLALALTATTAGAYAHQLWIERDASGPARVYVGDADDAPDRGEEVAKLAATTRVFTGERGEPAKLTAKDDHLEAAVSGSGDVRMFNDQVWKPWKTKDGKFQAAIFNGRAGRTETRAAQDFELVPVRANGNTFTLLFKGQPMADTKVTVVTPTKWVKGFKTDKAGRVEVPVREKGRYVLISAHNTDATGNLEIAGQKVDKLSYTATLTFVAQ